MEHRRHRLADFQASSWPRRPAFSSRRVAQIILGGLEYRSRGTAAPRRAPSLRRFVAMAVILSNIQFLRHDRVLCSGGAQAIIDRIMEWILGKDTLVPSYRSAILAVRVPIRAPLAYCDRPTASSSHCTCSKRR